MAMWARWAPPFERARLMTFSGAGSSFGAFVALPLTGFICHSLGWPAVFYSCGEGKLHLIYGCIYIHKSLGSVRFLFVLKEINSLILQVFWTWSKVPVKTFIIHKCCSFELSIHQRILKKCRTISANILSSTTVFNIDNNKKCFLWILEWFLKDYMTLKTGVIAAENSSLAYIIF